MQRSPWLGSEDLERPWGPLWEVQALRGRLRLQGQNASRPSIASQALLLTPLGTKGSCLATSQKVFEAGVRGPKKKHRFSPFTPCLALFPGRC